MQIKVYNDDQLVFTGTLLEFLSINENDDYLVEITANLETKNSISFNEISGTWLIEKL